MLQSFIFKAIWEQKNYKFYKFFVFVLLKQVVVVQDTDPVLVVLRFRIRDPVPFWPRDPV